MKYCSVKGGTTDDSAELLAAFQKCNNGGHVILNQDTAYTVGTAIDLKHVDWEIRGTLTFSNDTTYWQAATFKYAFQDTSSFLAIGGTDVNIYGGGLIDDNGQIWYDLAAANSSTHRPQLWNIDSLAVGSMSNLRMHNPPNWFNIVQNSSDLLISDLTLTVAAVGANPAKNTDGWDTYRSRNIVIQNSVVNNTDDCVSFKPNSTQILVQNLACSGSHGISVGSLGQYVGIQDIVEDVLVYNISMAYASDGARIKVYPGAPDATTLSSGGGSGYVRNVTYQGMRVNSVDWAIEVTGCYGNTVAQCAARLPSRFVIEDVLFKNFEGVTSAKNGRDVATVVCPSVGSCVDIRAEGFEVVSTKGTNEAVCSNVDETQLGLNCTSS